MYKYSVKKEIEKTLHFFSLMRKYVYPSYTMSCIEVRGIIMSLSFISTLSVPA